MGIERVGAGPWTVVEVMEPDYVSYGGAKLPDITVPAFAKSEFHCACCGLKLTWRVLVQDVPTGLHYVMGRACAKVADLPFTSKEATAALRAKRAKAKAARLAIIDDFLAAHGDAAKAQPHPFITGKGLTLADYLTWIRANKTTAADMLRAVGTARARLGLLVIAPSP